MKTSSFVLLLAVLAAIPAAFAAPPPSLTCETGPLHRTYGKTNWLVYSCNDLKSIAVVAAPGNPAGDFYFLWFAERGGKYTLTGEGNGNRTYTAPAFTELHALAPADIAALVAKTRGATSAQLIP